MKTDRQRRAFSMVEVVLALGIMVFCVVVLIGLFSVGVNTGRDSAEELQAAHLAQSLLATRRAAPNVELSADFPLPVVKNSGASVWLDNQGKKVPQEAARYKFSYRIETPDSPVEPALVWLRLSWPAQAADRDALGACELVTRLPQL